MVAATWETAGSVLGALIIYLGGMWAWDSIGLWLVTTFQFEEQTVATWQIFREYGLWTIVLIGMTPIPYHIALLLAGAAHYPIPLLLVAATIARERATTRSHCWCAGAKTLPSRSGVGIARLRLC